jgi:hypothetical protein
MGRRSACAFKTSPAVVRIAPVMWMEAILCTLFSFVAAPTDPFDLSPSTELLVIGVSQMLAP